VMKKVFARMFDRKLRRAEELYQAGAA